MRNTSIKMIFELAKKNEKVLFIGSDLSPGLLDEMKNKYPDRYMMEGISEQNLIGVSAGLALSGFIPFFVTIATFLTRRAYEQIYIDIGLHDLPVKIIGIGGGLNYANLGPTHIATDDLALMKNIPNLSIIVASDAEEMRSIMLKIINYKKPVYIRLAKGYEPILSFKEKFKNISIPRIIKFNQKNKVTILSIGIMSLKVKNILKDIKTSSNHIHVNTINSKIEKKIWELIRFSKIVITIEDHNIINGFGDFIFNIITKFRENQNIQIFKIGIVNKIINNYGTQDDLFKLFNLNESNLLDRINKIITKNKN